MTTEEDDRLDWEVGQHLWGSDWEDDEDFLDSQRPYSGREHGNDADSGWRAAAQAATCGATRVMATISAARAQEEAAQMVRTAGPRDEEERAAWEAAYLDMWADMRARAAQETPAHKEAAQAAETVGTATPSQTGQDVPTAKEEKLIVGGASASTAATTADEERRAVRGHRSRLLWDSCVRGSRSRSTRAGRPARSASQPYCQRGRRPPGRRASSASGSGPGARTPKGHGLEPPEAGVVSTGGARRQARTPPASAWARCGWRSGAESRRDCSARLASRFEDERRKAGGC
jgi:hypothetical protein